MPSVILTGLDQGDAVTLALCALGDLGPPLTLTSLLIGCGAQKERPDHEKTAVYRVFGA